MLDSICSVVRSAPTKYGAPKAEEPDSCVMSLAKMRCKSAARGLGTMGWRCRKKKGIGLGLRAIRGGIKKIMYYGRPQSRGVDVGFSHEVSYVLQPITLEVMFEIRAEIRVGVRVICTY